MARPERKNADYFPFYAKDGRTLFILEGKYRCKGTGFFTNVMRFLTLQDDHCFCIADETDQMYFMSKCHCDEVSGIEMLEIMVKTGKLDDELWENYKIIACQDLLDSLKDAYRKRTNDIITIDEIRVNAGINRNSGGRNKVKGGNNPQSKVKETKGKKSTKRFIPPSEKQVIDYFVKNGYLVKAGYRAFRYYDAADWKDGNGKQVKNWKQKMIGVWFKDENKDTVKITRGSKKICEVGPCQNPLSFIADIYCKECQIILDENGVKTYDEFVALGKGKDIKALLGGIGK